MGVSLSEGPPSLHLFSSVTPVHHLVSPFLQESPSVASNIEGWDGGGRSHREDGDLESSKSVCHTPGKFQGLV